MTAYGYARVSATDQNLDRQLDALGPLCDRIYTDKLSGKDMDRPEWKKLMRRLKPGDVLFVPSIDRMGRNYDNVCAAWAKITAKGADIVVLDMPLLDTRESSGGVTGKLISDIVIRLLAYVAQLEREKNRERQAQGIAAARARGKHLGRYRIPKPEGWQSVCHAMDTGRITRKRGAAYLGVSLSTFDTWRREAREEVA